MEVSSAARAEKSFAVVARVGALIAMIWSRPKPCDEPPVKIRNSRCEKVCLGGSQPRFHFRMITQSKNPRCQQRTHVDELRTGYGILSKGDSAFEPARDIVELFDPTNQLHELGKVISQ